MVTNRQKLGLVALGLAVVAALAYQWTSAPAPVVPAGPGRNVARRVPAGGAIPVIGLDRLAPRGEGRVGKRNVFEFAPVVSAPTPSRTADTAFVAVATSPPITTPPTPAPPPPLSVKYIGSVESKKGLKVAVFLTDRRELLTGQEGDVLANRMKVVRIGYESVDVQDVGSEHTRRIPLRGN